MLWIDLLLRLLVARAGAEDRSHLMRKLRHSRGIVAKEKNAR